MSESQPVLPTFIVAGAAKAGTTALYHWFNQHPGVYMSPVKEPHFFSELKPTFSGPGDDRFNQPIVTDWSAYCALFEAGAGFPVRGEASPSYLDLYPVATANIARQVPDAKIIILLRNPADRAFSEYVHLTRDGRETLSFRESLDAEEERMTMGWRRIWAHKARGLYADAVSSYLKTFGRDQVGVWLYEDLRDHPEATFRQMCQFVGADTSFVPFFSQVNVGGIPRFRMLHQWLNHSRGVIDWLRRIIPPQLRTRLRQSLDRMNLGKVSMSADDRAYLNEYYRRDVERLERILPETDFSRWQRKAAVKPVPAAEAGSCKTANS